MDTMKPHSRGGRARDTHRGGLHATVVFLYHVAMRSSTTSTGFVRLDLAEQVSRTRELGSISVAAVAPMLASLPHAHVHRSRLSVAHQSKRFAVVYPPLSRGVLGFSPPPVWLTESVPATAPRDFDAGNAAWFFSRDWPRWRGTPTANGKPGNPIGGSPRQNVTLLPHSA